MPPRDQQDIRPGSGAANGDTPAAAHAATTGLILSFGFLTAMAPLSVDIYLPALPMLQKTFAADEARTLLTLSAFLVGFGAGQLFMGPLSDRFGRKRPLIAGLVLYLAASVACALASSIGDVILWRFLQAVGGCAVPVMVQAMIRDLFDRDEGARILSLNMLVMGVAPIAAPLIGGQILLWFDWRGIFWVLALFGAVALAVAAALPETLTKARRDQAHPIAMILGYGELFRSRRYVGYVFGLGFYYCALFAFIAGSPFVYIEHFGVSPQNYGFLFGVNIVGMMIGSFINARIVVRHGSDRLLRAGKVVGIAGGIVLAITGTLGIGGIFGVAVPSFIVLSMLSMIGANAISGALALFPHRAGAASALSGALQFGMGALAGAVVGWLADGTPGPMCATMAGAAALALLLNLALVRRA